MIALVPVREGVLDPGGPEAIAESGGRVILIGSGLDEALDHAGASLIAWLLQQLNLPLQAVSGYKELDPHQQSPGAQWNAGVKWGDQLKAIIQASL